MADLGLHTKARERRQKVTVTEKGVEARTSKISAANTAQQSGPAYRAGQGEERAECIRQLDEKLRH